MSRPVRAAAGLLVVAVLVVTACDVTVPGPRPDPTGSSSTPPTTNSSSGPDLVVEGSDIMGATLIPELAMAFLNSLKATGVNKVEDPGRRQVVVSGILPVTGEQRRIIVRFTQIGPALENLGRETANVVMSARQLTEDERIRYDEYKVARTGVAVAVPLDSTVTSITDEQMKDIFTCRTSNWSDVPDAAAGLGPIHVHIRDDADLVTAVLGDDETPCSVVKRAPDDGTLSANLSEDKQGIGLLSVPYLLSNQPVTVIGPDGGSIDSTTDPGGRAIPSVLTRDLFLVRRKEKPDGFGQRFVDFVKRDPQGIIRKAGFLPPEPPPQPTASNPPLTPQPCPTQTPGYCTFISGASLVDPILLFPSNASYLDTEAVNDLVAVINRLVEDRPREVLVAGFADDIGADPINQQLSQDRAGVVATALSKLPMITATPRGFGKYPANDASPEQRAQHRRVEIWVR